MQWIIRHVTKCLIAGIVAVLPVFGTIFSLWYIETTIADPWLGGQPWYFFGLGMIFVAVLIYLLGLTVTTFIGRWFWKAMDRLLDRMPLLGSLYQTLKQLVGYGGGKDAVFREVVLLDVPDGDGQELGLVTNTVKDAAGAEKLLVFVPGSPNPTTGRLIITDRGSVRTIEMKVSEVMQSLVSVGATAVPVERART